MANIATETHIDVDPANLVQGVFRYNGSHLYGRKVFTFTAWYDITDTAPRALIKTDEVESFKHMSLVTHNVNLQFDAEWCDEKTEDMQAAVWESTGVDEAFLRRASGYMTIYDDACCDPCRFYLVVLCSRFGDSVCEPGSFKRKRC